MVRHLVPKISAATNGTAELSVQESPTVPVPRARADHREVIPADALNSPADRGRVERPARLQILRNPPANSLLMPAAQEGHQHRHNDQSDDIEQ